MANGVTIDWGDGSAVETLDGTGYVNTAHQYAETGDYTIALSVADGCRMGFGDGSYSCRVMGSTGDYGRVYCNLLQEAYIGDGVTGIGHNSFQQCCSLTSVTIPDSVTSIENYAFRFCHSLASVTIPDGVTSIGGNSFQQCYSLASINIPDSVTKIGPNSINYCASLDSFTIPDSVTGIDSYAFQYCYSLTSATIPYGVVTINSSVFQYCYSLMSVTVPSSVTSIVSTAFKSCYGMAEYHLQATTPPALGAGAFDGIPSDCIIYVPSGSLEAYKTAENWSVYADYMREEQ